MNVIIRTDAGDPEYCQICLGSLSIHDKEYRILCPSKCNCNICFNCCSHLVKMRKNSPSYNSSYEQLIIENEENVVLTLCPRCQDDLSLSIEDTFFMRKVMAMEGITTNNNIPDSELSAAELRLKHSVSSQQIEDAKYRLEKLKADIETGKISPRTTSPIRLNRRKKRNSDDVNDNKDSTSTGTNYPNSPISENGNNKKNGSSGKALSILPSSPILKFIGFDLFNGMQEILTQDEQSFISELMTSGDVEKLVQATQILYELRRIKRDEKRSNDLSNTDNKRKDKDILSSDAEKRALRMTLSTDQRTKLDALEEYLEINPLPKMPKYVMLDANFDVYAKHGKVLKFRDDAWDGTVSDAFTRVYSSKYNHNYNDDNCYQEEQFNNSNSFDSSDYRMQNVEEDGFVNKSRATKESRKHRVLIYAARKQASKICEVGDVVTHFEGMEFHGSASELRVLINGLYSDGNKSFSMVLNAEQGTADALKDFAVELQK